MNKRRKRLILRWMGAVFLLLWSLTLAHDEVSMAGNEAARFAVIQAVGEHQAVYIEKTDFRTVDKAIFNGHVYTDKPLFMSVTLGGIHRLLNLITSWNFHDNYNWLIYLFNVAVGFFINLLLFNWMFNALQRIRSGKIELKFILSVLAVPGTWLGTYSVMLNNHTPSALSVLGLMVALDKFWRKPAMTAALLSGCAAGILIALDIPAGGIYSIAGAAAIYFRKKHLPPLLLYCLTIGLWGVIISGINFVSYGDIRPVYILAKTYTPGIGDKNLLLYMLDTLLGTRGLLSYQPFLIMGIFGLWHYRSTLSGGEKTVAAATIAVAAFYWIFTNEYGGANYGFRYLIVIIPWLWYYSSLLVLKRKFSGKSILCIILIVWGIVTSCIGTYAPFCVAFEGNRTPPKHFSQHIRSTFTGNVLCRQFEKDPDGAFTRWLISRYEPIKCYRFLQASFFNMKKISALKNLQERKSIFRL